MIEDKQKKDKHAIQRMEEEKKEKKIHTKRL